MWPCWPGRHEAPEDSRCCPARPHRKDPVMTHTHDKILIVDFGSQVTQLIARRVREDGVYSEVVPFQKAAEAIRTLKPKGVILSGGPESVTTDTSPRAPKELFEAGLPVFGICYGQQTIGGPPGRGGEGGRQLGLRS